MIGEDRTNYVRVINNNAKAVVGRWNGKDYKFEPGKPLDVPEIVANHVFGFGQDDKQQALNRLGWARSSDEFEAGMELLANVVFEDPPELIEAPRLPKKAKGSAETGTAGPPVAASGTEGGAFKAPPDGPKIGQPAATAAAPAADAEDDGEVF
jgi:hypothetical protein